MVFSWNGTPWKISYCVYAQKTNDLVFGFPVIWWSLIYSLLFNLASKFLAPWIFQALKFKGMRKLYIAGNVEPSKKTKEFLRLPKLYDLNANRLSGS